jgi:truncated hemoglobin YjbI
MNSDQPRVTAPDAAASPDEPTLFEWAGGSEALQRMTQLFYEKYVPDDPLLAPVFADIGPDHPERVATWFGEVFGGPKRYSERYGGYERMLSRHLGRALSEEQRARWAQLMCECADEAGMPTDPEFKAAFVSYIEWGSRIALENSTPGAKPPEHMPVPRWWWVRGDAERACIGARPALGGGSGREHPRRRGSAELREAREAPLPGARPGVDDVRLRPLVAR